MGSRGSVALFLVALVGSVAAACSGDDGDSSPGAAGTDNEAGAGDGKGGGGATGLSQGGSADGGVREPAGGGAPGGIGAEGGTAPIAGQGSVEPLGGAAGEPPVQVGGDGGTAGAAVVSGGEGGGAGAEAGCAFASSPPAITKQGSAGLVLRGTVVTPGQVIAQGEVLVVGDTIACAAESCASTAGYGSATLVDTGGIIFPGLIDTHNQVLYDVFDETDWTPTHLYNNHDQWTTEARYSAMVDAKQYLNGENNSPVSLGCELDKYGELKGLIAGTTSMVGAAIPANKVCYGTLARTVDQTPNGLGADKVQVLSTFPNAASANGICANFADSSTDALLIHVGEGNDAAALAEFASLGTVTNPDGCLYSSKTAIVHGTALGDAEFSTMQQNEMSLVWTPRYNVFVFGGTDLTKTTNIPLALSKGINVSLAPDWSMGGSVNLLDEMRFANLVDDTHWGDILSAKQLTEMVTTNAARVLGLQATLGSIEVGKKADLLVIDGDRCAPYDALLAARPADVRLVAVGGTVLYGDANLQPLGPASPGCEALDVCGADKFVCVAAPSQTATDKFGQTLATITSSLTTALADYDAQNLSVWDFAPLAPLVKCE